MTVRELLQLLLDHALDGRGGSEEALVDCDGTLRAVANVETRIAQMNQAMPDLFVLVVADGPSPTPVATAITPRAPKL
jgi:hypothetical protein